MNNTHLSKTHSPNLLDLYTIRRGDPTPLGASVQKNGINFAIFSRHATSVTLVLFVSGRDEPIAEIPLHPHKNRTGHIWHIFIRGLDSKIRYGYRMDRHPNLNPHIHRFDSTQILIDPYAKALSGGSDWGRAYHRDGDTYPNPKIRKRRSLVIENDFDWGDDQPLNIPLSDLVIYELHVRGFSVDPSAKVKSPGTYQAIIEKIPYLQELGINAVELLPINEFEEMDIDRANPFNGQPLLNYWGYQTINFFSPKAAYATDGRHGQQVNEFKTMVKALHAAGIEVILDVVFNHTAEGDERGLSYSFRGIDNSVYYMLDPLTGKYLNYSGCGNTVNCNHPVVRDMILDCLRHWVTEMHVDGFRFDLASILGRGQDGSVLANPPLLERIASDPILANTKLIAEAWDAAGLYQVGSFPAWGRWAEWNGKFRDDVRRFVKSDPGMVEALAHRLIGSPDLYGDDDRAPYHSINFITSHDGFTLLDLVSYNSKHNEINGEHNRDGANDNYSWNGGVEGPSDDSSIKTLRLRQMKNMATLLLLSHGVPMIPAGDERGRTQFGNNNAYCQDNAISWLNWEMNEEREEIFRFFKLLIQFRHHNPALRRKSFIRFLDQTEIEMAFHGTRLHQPDWSPQSRTLAMQLTARGHLVETASQPKRHLGSCDIFLAANSHWEGHEFELPPLGMRKRWFRVVDTWLAPPYDIAEEGQEIPLANQNGYYVSPRTTVVLIGLKD